MNSSKVYEAIYQNDQATALKLISENISYPWLNLINRNGQSLVYCSARYGCLDLLKFLVSMGGEINRKEGREQSTPLHGACWGGHLDCVQFLLSQGANPLIVNALQETPLDNAKTNNFSEIVDLLISIIHKQHSITTENSSNEVFESLYDFEKRFDYPKMKIIPHSKVPDIYLSQNPTKCIKVVCVSDTHVHYNDLNAMKIPDGDIFIHCGDFSNMGTPEEYSHFNNYLGSLPHKHKIIVCGNHDLRLDTFSPDYVKSNVLSNCTSFLVDNMITIENINIWGSPWTGMGASFHVNHDSVDMATKYNKIPHNVDLLITHNPPFNVLDLAWVKMSNNGKCLFCSQEHPSFQHWGSKCLLQRVLEVKPKVHMFGHVHDMAGIGMLEGCETVFINAAMDLSPKPIVYNVYV